MREEFIPYQNCQGCGAAISIYPEEDDEHLTEADGIWICEECLRDSLWDMCQVLERHQPSFNNDGTKFYILDSDNNIHRYTLTTPWDMTSASRI